MKNLFFHIGFPKTGTTTLYDYILPKISKVSVFAPNTNHKILEKNLTKKELNDNFILKNFLECFLYSSRYNNEAINIIQNSNKDNIFLSSVNLLAAQFFKGLYTNSQTYISPELIADKIYEVFSPFFNVHIIISIRHQSDWVPSAFAEWHRYIPPKFGGNNFDKFSSMFLKKSSIFFSALNFNQISKVFENKFNKENVMIIYYEDLKENPKKFYISLLNWINADFNKEIINNLPHKNNRTLDGGAKKLEDINFLNFIFGLKIKYFPNLRLNLIKNVPLILKILENIPLPIKKTTIKPSKEILSKIFDVYLDSNNKFLAEHPNLPAQYYKRFNNKK